VVPARMQAIRTAILTRDFTTFATHTMRDSNSFHAVCLDTYPPISYLTDTSRGIIALITAYNALHPTDPRAAYTFDAGPNAVLYVRSEHVPEVLGLVDAVFPSGVDAVGGGERAEEYYGRARERLWDAERDAVKELVAKIGMAPYPVGSLRRIISTRVGDGPRILARSYDPQVSLLTADGLPKKIAA
ncbi:GHMP kinase, partial [Blyttiomyces helicus]